MIVKITITDLNGKQVDEAWAYTTQMLGAPGLASKILDKLEPADDEDAFAATGSLEDAKESERAEFGRQYGGE